MANQNIDSLGPNWTFSLRGVLIFVASGLDSNGCALSYFEGTANLHCYSTFPLHGTARYSSVRFTFVGFSTGYRTWYLVLF